MHNEITLREAEAFLHERIPITRVMGVRVVAQGNDGFIVEAPVSLNSNHLQTGFGGSINAVATLVGHGLLWLELREDKRAHFVVAESSIRFRRPVRETIRAICAPRAVGTGRVQVDARGKGQGPDRVKSGRARSGRGCGRLPRQFRRTEKLSDGRARPSANFLRSNPGDKNRLDAGQMSLPAFDSTWKFGSVLSNPTA